MPITILVVDDEEIVHKLIRVALMGFGDIVFLVAKDGAEMAAQLSQSRPEMKVVLMSGYPPEALTMKPSWHFIQKPFPALEIRERVGRILTDHSVAA